VWMSPAGSAGIISNGPGPLAGWLGRRLKRVYDATPALMTPDYTP